MSLESSAAPPSSTGTLLQLLLSALALFLGLLGAAGLFFLGFRGGEGSLFLQIDPEPTIALAWAVTFLAVPAIPSLIYAARRLSGRPVVEGARSKAFFIASNMLMLFPLAMAAGYLSTASLPLSRFVFPFAALLTAVIPLWWAVELARRNVPAGSPQRVWGVFNFSLYISTPIMFVLEVVGMVLMVILVIIWASSNPRVLAFLEELQSQVMRSQGDLETLRQVYQPMFRRPEFLAALYTAIAVIVPLLEELLKPLAVWSLAGRRLTPAAGFALGAVAGAGFAFIETLVNLAGSLGNPQWLVLASGRAGTSLLHVCTAALSGMAIAALWNDDSRGTFQKLIRFGLVYLAAVALHGLWNGLTITASIASMILSEPYSTLVSSAATIGLIILAVAFIVVLYLTNRRLRHAVALQQMPQPPAYTTAASSDSFAEKA